jgi:shikimate dehydrogenase
VMDLVYVPSLTPLLRVAADHGAVTVSGIGMLVHQAAIAIEHWTGLEAPVEEMWKAALEAVGG